MNKNNEPKSNSFNLTKLTKFDVFSISFGCAVGWGAFIMPGNKFLNLAGPLGTIIGIIVGALIMLIIGINYSFLINHYPDAGGAFTYTSKRLGFDHGFLCSWFMILVYLSITWSNATALSQLFRNIFGNFFQFGFHYKLAGFDVYFGEALFSIIVMLLLSFICFHGPKFICIIMTICASVLLIGTLVVFVASVTTVSISDISIRPLFSPNTRPVSGIISIVALTPWAFVGFESVSNTAEEFDHSYKDIIRIIILSIISITFFYCSLIFTAVVTIPGGYSDWHAYIMDLENLRGFEEVPVFYSISQLLGKTGVILFFLPVLGAVISGIVGNGFVLSRLTMAMKKQNMLPAWLEKGEDDRPPKHFLLLLLLVSLPVPFLGRSVIVWIVDISTVGAALAYLYTSYVTFLVAREEANKRIMMTGALGVLFSAFFFMFLLLPDFSNITTISVQSYVALVIWSIMGFLYFHYVYHKDKEWRFGNSPVVWAILLFLIFFTITILARQDATRTTQSVAENVLSHSYERFEELGIEIDDQEKASLNTYLMSELNRLKSSQMKNSAIQIILVSLSLVVIFNLYATMIKRQKKTAEDLVKVKNAFLSNMSHELRTPINTILGLDEMIIKETTDDGSREYANDIYIAGQLLVSLVNDVLDFSKIDSGNLELSEAEYDFSEMLSYTVADITKRAKAKGLLFDINIEKSFPKVLYGDSTRLRQIFLNLLSNSVKYTEEGRITLDISYTRQDENHILMKASVIDTGIGIHKEDLGRLFNTFDRINNKRSITASGAGLGMNIVKSLLDLMGGTLEIESVFDVGSNFTFTVPQEVIDWTPIGVFDEPSEDLVSDRENEISDFTAPDAKVLLVDDTEMNLFVFESYLKDTKLQIDTAKDGLEGLELTRKNEYDLLLIDHRMPFMDGVEMFNVLRQEKDNPNCEKPCICVTANAGIGAKDEYKSLGFDDYLAKPVSSSELKKVILEYLPKEKVVL